MHSLVKTGVGHIRYNNPIANHNDILTLLLLFQLGLVLEWHLPATLRVKKSSKMKMKRWRLDSFVWREQEIDGGTKTHPHTNTIERHTTTAQQTVSHWWHRKEFCLFTFRGRRFRVTLYRAKWFSSNPSTDECRAMLQVGLQSWPPTWQNSCCTQINAAQRGTSPTAIVSGHWSGQRHYLDSSFSPQKLYKWTEWVC